MSKEKEKKSGRFQARSFARRVALQVLYQEDLNPGGFASTRNEFIYNELCQLCSGLQDLDNKSPELPINDDVTLNTPLSKTELDALTAFVYDITSYAFANRTEIDEKILSGAENWSLSRMAKTDRNILRLAVAERLCRDTPKAVIIHEALELGGQFGSGRSTAFLNGILDKILD